MDKNIFDLGNYLDELLTGNVSKEELQIKVEEEMLVKNPGYKALTIEEKNQIKQRGLTVDSAYEIFNDYMYKNNLAKSTIKQRQKRMRGYKRFIEESNLKFLEIREEEIIFYLSEKHRDSKSKNNSPHLQFLRAFYNFLYKEKYIEYNPITGVVKDEINSKRNKTHNKINSLTTEEVKELIMSFDLGKENELKNKVIVLLLLETGITLSELCKIKIEDIFKEQNIIYINTARNGINRNVNFSAYTKNIIYQYINIFQISEGSLLEDSNEDSVYQILKRKSKSIGFECNSKVLRNTFVLHQMRNGIDAYSLQELLGFTTAKALARYKKSGAIYER